MPAVELPGATVERYTLPVSVPTVGVTIVAVPIALPAEQLGSEKVVASNCAAVQPVSAPSELIEELSDTPLGRSTEAFSSAPCGLPGVEAGAVIFVENAAAPAALAGVALKLTDGEKPSEPQPVAWNGLEPLAVRPPAEP